MRWLNYHHLYYFWIVAKKGSVTEACKELRLAQPTVSAQLKALEDSLNEKLFEKSGRYLKLTESGNLVFKYAEEIFSLGNEMMDVLEGKPSGKPAILKVGISNVVPKLVVNRLLKPAYELNDPLNIICVEDQTDKLLNELASQNVDLIITDSPIPPSMKVKAYNHFLGECGVSFVGSSELAESANKDFPNSLGSVPVLLPTSDSSVRQELNRWFDEIGVTPNIVSEFQDSALMKTMGKSGVGIFPVPQSVEKEVLEDGTLEKIKQVDSVKERFYLITAERKVKNPAAIRICDMAGRELGV